MIMKVKNRSSSITFVVEDGKSISKDLCNVDVILCYIKPWPFKKCMLCATQSYIRTANPVSLGAVHKVCHATEGRPGS